MLDLRLRIAAAVVLVMLPIGGFLAFHYALVYERDKLQKRHVEASSAIELIYGHFDHFGTWPDEDEMYWICRENLPSDWRWWAASDEEDATVVLSGGLHMSIYYHCEPPRNGVIHRDWTFNEEGSKQSFRGSVQYAVDELSERDVKSIELSTERLE